jgi:hypothetical protein
MAISEGKLIFRQLTTTILNASGVFGFLLIGYGYAVGIDPSWSWPLIDKYAPFISAILTLAGTFLTSASVYFPVHSRQADAHSRKVIAPFVCFLAFAFMLHLFFNKSLSDNIINGFGILGLSGGLFRLLPWSEESGLNS